MRVYKYRFVVNGQGERIAPKNISIIQKNLKDNFKMFNPFI